MTFLASIAAASAGDSRDVGAYRDAGYETLKQLMKVVQSVHPKASLDNGLRR